MLVHYSTHCCMQLSNTGGGGQCCCSCTAAHPAELFLQPAAAAYQYNDVWLSSVIGLLMLTSLIIQGTVVVDICIAQGPASHSITADTDGSHRADLKNNNETFNTTSMSVCACRNMHTCCRRCGRERERRLLLQDVCAYLGEQLIQRCLSGLTVQITHIQGRILRRSGAGGGRSFSSSHLHTTSGYLLALSLCYPIFLWLPNQSLTSCNEAPVHG